MEYRLTFPKNMYDKLSSAASDASVKMAWTELGIDSADAMISRAVELLAEEYPKTNITDVKIIDKNYIKAQIDGCNRVSDFLGYISIVKENSEVIVSYCFMIPPNYNGRSTVLAQQVIPTMSGIMNVIKDSLDYKFSNRPIYVINFNEASMPKSVATNILCADILGLRYIDIFKRNAYEILQTEGINIANMNIQSFDSLIKETSDNNQNEIFQINAEFKKITFLVDRLKDGVNVHNEPYWYCLKAYAAIYLALADKYKIDMSVFSSLQKGNPTLDAFRLYVKKLGFEEE